MSVYREKQHEAAADNEKQPLDEPAEVEKPRDDGKRPATSAHSDAPTTKRPRMSSTKSSPSKTSHMFTPRSSRSTPPYDRLYETFVFCPLTLCFRKDARRVAHMIPHRYRADVSHARPAFTPVLIMISAFYMDHDDICGQHFAQG